MVVDDARHDAECFHLFALCGRTFKPTDTLRILR